MSIEGARDRYVEDSVSCDRLPVLRPWLKVGDNVREDDAVFCFLVVLSFSKNNMTERRGKREKKEEEGERERLRVGTSTGMRQSYLI